MKILIDIGHPAHVHLFKHFAWEMQKKGHEVFFTCREKEYEIELLNHYGFNFKSFGKKYSSFLGKLWGMIKFDVKEFLTGIKFKPDILLSHGSIYAAHAAFFLKKPHIAMEDTGNMEQIKLYNSFSDVILTPNSLQMDLGKKQIKYNSYHELAYLHPNIFIPDNNVLKLLNLGSNDKFVVFRFVSWKASHDINQKGIDSDLKHSLPDRFIKLGYRIFISSENSLPMDLRKYKINISPHYIHHLLYFAELFIGEGATMANESAILGTPAIYVNSRKACIGDLEKYGLLYHLKETNHLIPKIDELLRIGNIKQEWQKRRQKMLADKIDVTAFLVWFVENHPESVRVMRERPEVQYRFK